MEEKKETIRPLTQEAIAQAKDLLHSAGFGALAVLDPESGAPLVSRVGVATDFDGAPLIFVSALAAHTGALQADGRCSLLVGEPSKGDALSYPRLSIICLAREIARGSDEHGRMLELYLAHLPKAKLYAQLPDFRFFRLEPQSASLNGGFGKAYLLSRANLMVESQPD